MHATTSCILTVDDDPAIHRMIQRVLRPGGCSVISAHSGPQALEAIGRHPVDLVLLDLSMPGMDGFQVAAQLKFHTRTRHIPVILFTGMDTVENHTRALEAGVDDFLPKNADPAIILARVRSHLKIKRLNDQVAEYQDSLEKKVANQTRQLKSASLETIVKLSAASEFRDNETGAHIQRMSRYAAVIAKAMGLKTKAVEAILYSAPMHDVGKIGIPDRILLKPGPLDDGEWEIMKTHPEIGAKILRGSHSGFVKMAETIALTHHEKWDGSGYPRGLKGDRIPLVGQVVALADAFDALTSARPYKDAISGIEAIRIIQEGRGSHFAPRVVDSFFTVLDRVLTIKEQYRDGADRLDQGGPVGVVYPQAKAATGSPSARVRETPGASQGPGGRPRPPSSRLSARVLSWFIPSGVQ